ncbi:glycosyltransferase [Pseudarthrobacter sp. NIBRBAC000502771]|uniref:glycosyltransferase n=1 Tax=Pseudarthrobacter sp. NIBRBAC000502771 TaxID=2590774 RepID=UPI001131CADB|nr:glycosyltransferase [Pseudarthrobacter sp. NIBRBAC000502771]QDG62556.1 glycosyltransferase [Pseudarthrobacter sp. NIBRBAC000502771]
MAIFKPNPELLRRQIKSIQRQTLADWNCIIGIDGLDNDALSLLNDIVQDDRRFKIHEYEHRVGFYHNFERLLAGIPGEAAWVALSDQDDVWDADKLEKLVPHLSTSSLVVGQARVVQVGELGHRGITTGYTDRSFTGLADLVLDNVVTGALTVFRTDLLAKALPFPARTDVAFHDHWLGVCAVLEKGITFIPDTVQDYVQHGANVIGEETSARFLVRLKRLTASGNLTASVEYLVNHRWRWRVQMCRAALERFATSAASSTVLCAFANDRCSRGFLILALRAVLHGNSSRLRVAALLVASALAPMIPKETNYAKQR